MQYLYLPAATVLKRWAGETAGAVYVHVDESLQGMDVIRAFNAVDYFIQVGGNSGEFGGGIRGGIGGNRVAGKAGWRGGGGGREGGGGTS